MNEAGLRSKERFFRNYREVKGAVCQGANAEWTRRICKMAAVDLSDRASAAQIRRQMYSVGSGPRADQVLQKEKTMSSEVPVKRRRIELSAKSKVPPKPYDRPPPRPATRKGPLAGGPPNLRPNATPAIRGVVRRRGVQNPHIDRQAPGTLKKWLTRSHEAD